jgi:hypothetical protein
LIRNFIPTGIPTVNAELSKATSSLYFV